jgi:hypothetical protein
VAQALEAMIAKTAASQARGVGWLLSDETGLMMNLEKYFARTAGDASAFNVRLLSLWQSFLGMGAGGELYPSAAAFTNYVRTRENRIGASVNVISTAAASSALLRCCALAACARRARGAPLALQAVRRLQNGELLLQGAPEGGLADSQGGVQGCARGRGGVGAGGRWSGAECDVSRIIAWAACKCCGRRSAETERVLGCLRETSSAAKNVQTKLPRR